MAILIVKKEFATIKPSANIRVNAKIEFRLIVVRIRLIVVGTIVMMEMDTYWLISVFIDLVLRMFLKKNAEPFVMYLVMFA